MKNKRIIVYVGQSGPLDLFTGQIVKGFHEMGAEVFTYDLKTCDNSGLSTFCFDKVDAIVSFNTMFYNMLDQHGKNAWEDMDIPYITILVDHPVNYSQTLLRMSGKDTVLCIDRKHAEFVGRYYSNIGHYGFMPHGGTRADDGFLKKISDRKIDILYAGGIADIDLDHVAVPEEIYKTYSGIFNISEFVSALLRLMIANTDKTVEDVIESYTKEQWGLDNENDIYRIIEDFSFLHNYVLTYYRIRVLEKAAESGYQLYIYGKDYSKYDFTKKDNVHIMGNVSPEEVLKIMCDSKIVLSMMAWFKDGSHERVYNGMLAKAVVLSEETEYLRKTLTTAGSDQQIVLYDLNDLDSVPKKIDHLMSDLDTAEVIAANGYEKALRSETWIQRGHEIYDYINTISE